jgi:arylsulfatase A-like enzyme
MDSKRKTGTIATLAVLIIIALIFIFKATSETDPKPPNVLLITIDALRADHLGSYGYHLETSPFIDSLAKKGVLFSDATPAWPKTYASMSSMNTGMYPKTSGLRNKKRKKLPSTLKLLSEIFKENNYTTSAVVANFNVGRTYGFDRGFDHFVESWQDMWKQKEGDTTFENTQGKVKFFTNATIITDQALKWLQKIQNDETPFYLWLHYMEPHGPYIPPKSYLQYFRNAHKPYYINIKKIPKYQVLLDSKTKEPINNLGFYKAQYDREIRYIDDELSRLIGEIKKLNQYENTIIIISADHGESLGEHNYYLEHGLLSYQPCAHIPLIFIGEGRIPEGRIINEPVGLIDLPPTLMELAGIEIPSQFEGQSLVELMFGEKNATAPEYIFMESGYDGEFPQQTIRRNQWKLIHVTSRLDLPYMSGSEYELYDLSKDPGELENLAYELPDITKELGSIFDSWYRSGFRIKEKGNTAEFKELDPKQKQLLKSLGYME